MKTKHRTNSKHVRALMRAHILECVTDGDGNTFDTIQDAAAYVRAEFERVAGYANNLRRFPNHQERFHDYLMGLPFGFEFYNVEIARFLNSLGINPEGREFDASASARLYSNLIYREVAL